MNETLRQRLVEVIGSAGRFHTDLVAISKGDKGRGSSDHLCHAFNGLVLSPAILLQERIVDQNVADNVDAIVLNNLFIKDLDKHQHWEGGRTLHVRPNRLDLQAMTGQLIGFLEAKLPVDPAIRGAADASRHVPQAVKDAVWRRDAGRCVDCGSQENLEFDHIIPHSKGGSNTARNIQLLCENCNRGKSDQIG